MGALTGNQLLPLSISFPFRANSYNHLHSIVTPFNTRKNPSKSMKLSAKIDDSSTPNNPQQQVNLSVLRFTFGISWLDESYLPRYLGYGFGSLIILNHFIGSNSSLTSAQIVSETLGLFLAAFSISLPFVGRFLKPRPGGPSPGRVGRRSSKFWRCTCGPGRVEASKQAALMKRGLAPGRVTTDPGGSAQPRAGSRKGATPDEPATLPQRAQQIFVMSPNVSDTLKEDLAWTTYILLRNTKSVSVLICLQNAICIRGYWNLPEKLSKDEILNWFLGEIKKFGLPDLEETLYFAQRTGAILEEAIPEEIGSILIQPLCTAKPLGDGKEDVAGFVLVASSISYAYDEKDVLWIKAIANKFKGETVKVDSGYS